MQTLTWTDEWVSVILWEVVCRGGRSFSGGATPRRADRQPRETLIRRLIDFQAFKRRKTHSPYIKKDMMYESRISRIWVWPDESDLIMQILNPRIYIYKYKCIYINMHCIYLKPHTHTHTHTHTHPYTPHTMWVCGILWLSAEPGKYLTLYSAGRATWVLWGSGRLTKMDSTFSPNFTEHRTVVLIIRLQIPLLPPPFFLCFMSHRECVTWSPFDYSHTLSTEKFRRKTALRVGWKLPEFLITTPLGSGGVLIKHLAGPPPVKAAPNDPSLLPTLFHFHFPCL